MNNIRAEFHPQWKSGYSPVNAVLLARAADAAYNDEDGIRSEWVTEKGFRDVRYFDVDGSQAFIASGVSNGKPFNIVAFRGTEPPHYRAVLQALWDMVWRQKIDRNEFDDLLADANIQMVPCYFGGRTKMHAGFFEYTSKLFLPVLNELKKLSQDGEPTWITGHSLGAALATDFAGRLANARKDGSREVIPEMFHGVYPYESPRVYNREGAMIFDQEIANCWRHVNRRDIVCRVPVMSTSSWYKHVAIRQIVYYSSSGRVHVGASPLRIWLDRWWSLYRHGPTGISDHSQSTVVTLAQAYRENARRSGRHWHRGQ